MNLGRNVFNLLKRQTKVYVKGLGSFKRNLTSSAFDEKNNVYLPPIAYLDFDQASLEGYDFIQYIQQLNEIERTEADNQVSQAVTIIKQQITEEGQVKLDDLGYLVSYGEAYVFKPLDLSGFHLEAVAVNPACIKEEEPTIEPPFVGDIFIEAREEAPVAEVPPEEEPVVIAENPAFESLLIDNVETSPAADVEAAPAEVTSIVAETPVAQPADIPAAAEEEPFEEEEFETRKKSNTIWYILLILVGLGVMGGLYVMNNNIQLFPANVPADTTALEVPLVDTATVVLEADSADMNHAAVDSVQVDSVKTEKPEVKEETFKTNPKHEWQLVIGTHATLAQAYTQAESYNKAGYPHVRVVPSNLAKNKKKVIWDSYETKDQVDSAAIYVKKHIIKDAWQDKINK